MGSTEVIRLTETVPEDLDGGRADRAVAVMAGVSRSTAQQSIDAGGVSRDGQILARRDTVHHGDVLDMSISRTEVELAPESLEFDVVWEDAHLAVIDKPAGMVVHPGAGRGGGTLANGLLGRWPDVKGVGESNRWGIVHRLDRETSGAIVVAKTADAYLGLQTAIRDRAVTRRYLCLVRGDVDIPTGTIDAPINRDEKYPTRMRVDAAGRRSITHYRVAKRWPAETVTLLELTLETGRTHQIRVHLESIDYPVIGDRVYGRPARAGVDPGRVWLHAAHLGFDHPITGDRIEVDVPLPTDLATTLEVLDESPTPV